ncbi:cyclic nucleotide-gated cation channel beta-3 isoform X2 [Nymphalis io]|uniref:cyclic nucleotide-gated cation channel beta-3 isoform X2 n=1 Tax=Inachis io TaxID=171585 RepID=UPI00216A8046|nr:cyclic nucleotide-gated cation channel beta-3 isoform X2 [Nymphalis io]
MLIYKRHTVRPSPPNNPVEDSANGRGPYESWGTPESTPTRNIIKETNTIESIIKVKDDKEERKKSALPPQRVRFLQNDFLDHYELEASVTDYETELKDLDEDETIETFEIKPEKPAKKVQLVDTPDSDPPSPIHKKESKGFFGFSLPSFFDPSKAIDCQSKSYIAWLLLVTFCYSYNAWSIALRASFPYQTPENVAWWMTADYFCDAIYLLDLMLIKPRIMFLFDGFIIEDTIATKTHYKRKLQYKYDVMSLLPLDILYVYFGTKMVILRFPRLLKLQTFWDFHRAMDRILHCPYVVRVGKTLFYIFYLIHLNACAYYLISYYIGLGSDGWVYDNKGNAYIRCFYFATKTATSIGKNPKPEKPAEYLFMTFAWLMGVFVFALLISQIRDIIATATKARTDYRMSVDACSWYLRKQNLPLSVQRRIACWFNFTWNQQRCIDESRILSLLPYNMKRDVALYVHMSILSQVQLFRDCSSSLLRDLVLQLKPVSYLPGDVVVRRGDVGHHMYIVKSGECLVMSADEKEVVAVLKTGSVFGEISLLGIEGLRRRTATVRSRGYSTLFVLSRDDLESALEYHKEAAQILRHRADQIIQENAARQAMQAMQTRDHFGGDFLSMQPNCRPPASGRRRRRVSAQFRPPSITVYMSPRSILSRNILFIEE